MARPSPKRVKARSGMSVVNENSPGTTDKQVDELKLTVPSDYFKSYNPNLNEKKLFNDMFVSNRLLTSFIK